MPYKGGWSAEPEAGGRSPKKKAQSSLGAVMGDLSQSPFCSLPGVEIRLAVPSRPQKFSP